MDPTDITVEILKSIRDEVRGTNVRLDQTVERLDQTVERLDQTVERIGRVEQRQIATEVRLATELVAVVGAVNEVRDILREDRGLRPIVADHEQRIHALEQRDRR